MNNTMDMVMLVLRYMHILGAIMLMGGTFFARFAVVPSLKKLNPVDQETVHTELRRRWSKFVHIASFLLLVSGLANLGIYGATLQFPTFPYNMVAGIKFLLALPIFFIAALIVGRGGLARRVQTNTKYWLTVNLVLATLMVLIGGGLRFVERVPKQDGKKTDALTKLVQIAIRDDNSVKAALGESLNFTEPKKAAGYAKSKPTFEFDVTGSKSKGKAHLEAIVGDAEWKIGKLEITCEDKTKLTIDPAAVSKKKSDDPTEINLPVFDNGSEEMPEKK